MTPANAAEAASAEQQVPFNFCSGQALQCDYDAAGMTDLLRVRRFGPKDIVIPERENILAGVRIFC